MDKSYSLCCSIQESRKLGNASWESLLTSYNKAIKDGPIHLCSSCAGLWFKRSIHDVSFEYFTERGHSLNFVQTLLQEKSLDGSYQLCGTCFNSALKGEIPKRNLSN